MTTVAVLADPPREGVVLPALSPSPLDEADATFLYRAMLADVTTAIDASGGELLVNFRDDEDIPDVDADNSDVDVDSETQLREDVGAALESLDDVRFEVQVGDSFYARAGNTITHLLERQETQSAAVVTPRSAFMARSTVDSAAMKLRSADVVLGPSTDGRVYYAAFTEPIDFEEAFETPTVETLTQRARDGGLSVDFLPMQPVIERPADLLTAIPVLRARRNAERRLPVHTTAAIEELGLSVADEGDGATIVRD